MIPPDKDAFVFCLYVDFGFICVLVNFVGLRVMVLRGFVVGLCAELDEFLLHVHVLGVEFRGY